MLSDYFCISHNMIKFQYISYLYALLVLIPILLLYFSYLWGRKRATSRFANAALFKRLAPLADNSKNHIKFIIGGLGLIFLIIGWANPQIGTKYEKVQREGVDVIIALDVSKSMLAKDITPQRLMKSKQLISNLIDKMAKDRVGFIVFAGNAYLQVPLTVDYAATKMYLKSINTNMIPRQGTAIAQAVNLANRSFQQDEDKHKALIIISDGEDHQGDADKAIEAATKTGVVVHTVGVGSDKGAPIPINERGEYLKDNEGNIVLSKLNKQMLKEMAKKGNGSYFHIDEANLADKIMAEIDAMEGKFIDEKVIAEYQSQFPIFLSIAFALLLIELLIPYRKIIWSFKK